MKTRKVIFINDATYWHGSRPHAGSKAVADSLCDRIQKAGHRIVARCQQKRNPFPTEEGFEQADTIIVNGEGHYRQDFRESPDSYLKQEIAFIRKAIKAFKDVYLVNTVWCDMIESHKDWLEQLAGVSVREPESAEQIYQAGARNVEVHPDESLFTTNGESEPVERRGWVSGYCYQKPHEMEDYMAGHCFNRDWPSLVKLLRHTQCYFTGQHHGVCAAIVAKCPFIPLRVNTHKITSLISWAGFQCQLADNFEALKLSSRWHELPNIEAWKPVWDWHARQKPWPIPE